MSDELSSFIDQVQARLTSLQMSPYQAENAFGLSRDSIRNLIREKAGRTDAKGPTFKSVAEISAALGLDFYIGPPRDASPPERIAVETTDYAHVPLHDAALSAGAGAVNETEDVIDRLAFRIDWLRKLGIAPGNARLVRVRGTSMEPTIADGDMVMIDTARTTVPPEPKRLDRKPPIFAFRHDGEAMVKRLILGDFGIYIAQSDNPNWSSGLFPVAETDVLGKVMWWGHTNRE